MMLSVSLREGYERRRDRGSRIGAGGGAVRRSRISVRFPQAFGNKETTIKRLRSGSSNIRLGGVLQRNNIHIAVCPPGRVAKTLAALRASPKTAASKAKFILATDGADI